MQDQLVNLYFILAIGYNLLSIARADLKGSGLAPTDPMAGITLMCLLYLLYSLDTVLPETSRQLLILSLLALVVRFGIVRHLFSTDLSEYSSSVARYGAALINILGVVAISTSLLL